MKKRKLFNKLQRFKWLLVAMSVTVTTFIFANSLKNYLQSEAAFSKTFKSADYILLDCYESIEESKLVGIRNPNVVIVHDDECNRTETASLIHAIDKLSPAAIGIDHIYEEKHPHDDPILIQAINSCNSPIVLASVFSFDTEYQKNTTNKLCAFSDSLKDATWGVANLDEPNVSPQHIIRRVCKSYSLEDGSMENSFAYELALQSKLSKDELSKAPSSSFICFRGLNTDRLSWDEILNENKDADDTEYIENLIRGKIVLIGSGHDQGDLHIIPSEECISGVEIHAASIYTLLNNKHVTESPKWVNNMTAILCVFIFSVLLYYSSKRLGRLGNLFIRIVQAAMMLLFIILGYAFYQNEQNPLYIDFSTSIVMIGVSAFTFDILIGMYCILKFGYKKIKK